MKIIVTYQNKLIITNIIIYICIFLLLANSEAIVSSINVSLNIFIHNLIPSLFVYLLITEIFINSNLIYSLSFGLDKILSTIFKIPKNTTFILIISYLTGYPNAAKCISKLYLDKKIDFNLACKLLSFTNNASPAFILSVIGLGIFNNMQIGILLLLSHFLSSILLGITFPYTSTIIQQNTTNSNSFYKISSSFQIISISILNSLKTLGIILGYTIIFSLIPALLFKFVNLPECIKGIIIGIFEITNGITTLANCNLHLNILLPLISFLLSFSSFMIIFQIYTFTYKTGIKFSKLLFYKLIHGSVSLVITYILIKINIFNISLTDSVYLNLNSIKHFQIPINLMYFLIITITMLILFLTLKKKR